MKPFVSLFLGALSAALSLGLPAAAQAATFIVPPHYQVELVDGEEDDLDISGRRLTLDAGRHQIVLLFKDTFGSNQNERIITAANPIVIDIADLGADEVMTFRYDRVLSINDATRFSRNQKGTLTDGEGNPIPQERASYFILTSDSGFALLRSYRTELLGIGRLYTRSPELAQQGRSSVNSQGVATVSVSPGSALLATSAAGQVNDTGLTYYQSRETTAPATETSAQAQASGSALPASGRVKLNDLITMYNRADDRTREQFLKWIGTQ